MYDIKTDTKKNRIIITIGKLEGEAEIKALSQSIKTACRELKKGFTCITDLRKYAVMDDHFEKYVQETQAAMIQAGLSRVVRVRRETGLLGHFQFDNASNQVGYHAQNVTTMEEAEKILDGETP
jgi:hypothetical protein